MSMENRSYNSRIYRPRPVIEQESDGSFVAVATPWGERSATEKAVSILRDYVLSASEDFEATSPFAKIMCLSPLGNNLRAGIRLMNDTIYNDDNQDEYRAGTELFVMSHVGAEVVWAQVGLPHVLLDREGFPLIPLGNSPDMSMELSQKGTYCPPLPMNLLGLAPQSNFSIQSLRPQPGDRLLFVSRSYIPTSVLSLSRGDRNIEIVSDMIATIDTEAPFWVGSHSLFTQSD